MNISGTIPPHIANFNDIGDVSVPAPIDGYFVYWDAAAGKWQCKEVVTTVDHLNDIGDVNVPAPADQYFLYWDDAAGRWQCRALIDGDIPATIARDAEVDAAIATLKEQMIDGPLSPMILTGGIVSEGTVGTITVSALTALLRSGTGETDPLVYVTLAEQANLAIPAANTKYHVVLTNTPAIVFRTTPANGTTEIGIGTCMKDTSIPVNTYLMNTGMRLQDGVAKLHRRAATLRQSELASGCTISDVGGGSRQFSIAKGIVYHGINRLTPFADAPYNPYISGDDKFTYVYRDGPNSWSMIANSTVIDNTQYYNGAYGLSTLGVTRYGCHWVYIIPDHEEVYVLYGTSNGKLAEAELEQPPGDLPYIIANFGMFLGRIIIERDATAFAEIHMASDIFFVGTAVADHGQLGGLEDDDHIQYLNIARHDLIERHPWAEEALVMAYLGV